MTVTCAVVDHPLVPLGARVPLRLSRPIDRVLRATPGAQPNLIALARGADILVHEALYLPRRAGRARIRRYASTSSTAILRSKRWGDGGRGRREDPGLSHFVPSENPPVTDERMARTGPAAIFAGRIVVGRDLLEL